MKSKKYELLIDIYKGVLNNQLIEFTTEDAGKCELEFNLLEDRITPYDLTGCLLRMVIQGQQQDCTIVGASGGKAKITLLQSMFTTPGFVVAELQIYDATNQTLRLTTPRFKYNIHKSLMNDNTAQADPNFSILQNMIIDVSNADKVSKEALQVANQAKAIVDDLVPKTNDAATKAQEALDRATSIVTQEELANKVTIDSNSANFNFMQNKAEQDGLVDLKIENISGTGGNAKILTQQQSDRDFTLLLKFVFYERPTNISVDQNQFMLCSLYTDTNKDYIFINKASLVTSSLTPSTFKFEDGKVYEVAIIHSFRRIHLYINGDKITEFARTTTEQLRVNGNRAGGYTTWKDWKGSLYYDHILTQREITHAFNAMDNLQSISALETTSSDGTKVKHLFHSDSQVVAMRDERTLNEFANEVLDWEEKTADTSGKIEIGNCKRAWLKNFTIEGQTVKNECDSENIKIQATGGTILGDTIIIDTTSDSTDGGIIIPISELQISTEYTLIYEVLKNDAFIGEIKVDAVASYPPISYTKLSSTVGVHKIKFTTKSVPATSKGLFKISTSNQVGKGKLEVSKNFSIVKDNSNFASPYTPFGLSSTQCIIENNGMKYQFYASEEDKANGKVLELSKVGDIADKIELLDDGSGVYIQNTKELILNGEESGWRISGKELTETKRFALDGGAMDAVGGVVNALLSNMYISKHDDKQYTTDEEGICINTNGILLIRCLRNKASTVDEWKAHLSRQALGGSPLTIRYKLKEPIKHQLVKELIPVILTNKTNICRVDSAVSPSSFKATFPVDKVSLMEIRLAALEAKTNIKAVNVPYIEETLTISKNKIEEVMKNV